MDGRCGVSNIIAACQTFLFYSRNFRQRYVLDWRRAWVVKKENGWVSTIRRIRRPIIFTWKVDITGTNTPSRAWGKRSTTFRRRLRSILHTRWLTPDLLTAITVYQTCMHPTRWRCQKQKPRLCRPWRSMRR